MGSPRSSRPEIIDVCPNPPPWGPGSSPPRRAAAGTSAPAVYDDTDENKTSSSRYTSISYICLPRPDHHPAKPILTVNQMAAALPRTGDTRPTVPKAMETKVKRRCEHTLPSLRVLAEAALIPRYPGGKSHEAAAAKVGGRCKRKLPSLRELAEAALIPAT